MGKFYFTCLKGDIEYPCNRYTKIRYWYRFLYQKIRVRLKNSLFYILKKL